MHPDAYPKHTTTATEWAVGLPDRDGWHAVYHREVEITRTGIIVKRRGIAHVVATAFKAEDALLLARTFAERDDALLRKQTIDDLRHTMLDDTAAA